MKDNINKERAAMSRYPVCLVCLACLLIAMTGAGQAGVPCPDLCTVAVTSTGEHPPEAVVCPAGHSDHVIVIVTAIDCYGVPVESLDVAVYPDPEATGFCFCPGQDTLTVITGSDGVGTVEFGSFGGCGDLRWYAEARYVIMGPSPYVYINSPDCSNNDCEVGLTDFIRFATSYLSSDPCCDYNRDGGVGLTDFIYFAGHYTHACQ
jgi:hypothetical protein